MIETKIFREDWEVDFRLGTDFGVTKAELMTVAERAVGARAESVPHDPATAPGYFSYSYGTRRLRDVFASKGWIPDGTNGIESICDPEIGTKIIFQNTDSACDVHHPKAISEKGRASERLMESAHKTLFESEEEYQKRLNGSVWYFCVYANGDDVRAELSRPAAIKGGQFTGFIERIFILNHGEWGIIIPSKTNDNIEIQDFDVPVTRK